MTQESITPPITPVISPTAPTQAVATTPTPPVTPAPAGIITIDQFFAIKLRVAKILSVTKIEKSKKLLKLQVDLGPELGQRQILSGIALHYTPEALIGKKIVVIANLTPAKMMGEESQGMLLASSSADGTKLTLLDPGQDMPEGSEVR
jgi:methionyl-tRNA synthetase